MMAGVPLPAPWAVIATVAVAAVGVGGVAGIVLLDDDDDGRGERAAATSTTTTTTAAPSSAPPTEPTTAAPSTTATTATTRPSTTTTAVRTTTTTTTTTAAACGTGRATVAFVAKDLVTDAQSSTFVPQGVVDNQVSTPIEVAELVIEVVYPGGGVRSVRFATAGTVIAPGTSATFSGERITTEKPYESVRIARFGYHAAGRRECLVSAP